MQSPSSSTDFNEKSPISNFTKIRAVRAELMHADRRTDRQTDMVKLKGAFRECTKGIKMCWEELVTPAERTVNPTAYHWT
jgi:hypothetical protein